MPYDTINLGGLYYKDVKDCIYHTYKFHEKIYIIKMLKIVFIIHINFMKRNGACVAQW